MGFILFRFMKMCFSLPIKQTDRLHILGRALLCPMDRIAALVPFGASVLEIGCGHGLFVYTLRKAGNVGRYLGLDPSKDKIISANKAFGKLPKVSFEVSDFLYAEVGNFDVVAILDVFYLIDKDLQEKILKKSSSILNKGGCLIIKEVDDKPKCKAFFSRFGEFLAVKVFRITYGHDFHYRNMGEWNKVMKRYFDVVECVRMGKMYPHPHFCLIGSNP